MTPFLIETQKTLTHHSRNEILNLLQEHKLVLLRGLSDFSSDEFVNFFTKKPEQDLVQWDFGSVMEMRETSNAENYLFSREAVPFHWDGAFHIEPSTLVFHCVHAPPPGAGGETIFCDAENLWSHATLEQKRIWERITLTYRTEKKAHYGGKIRVGMVAEHPAKCTKVLRYAEPVDSNLNPVTLEVCGHQGSESEFVKEMKTLLYKNHYAHVWQKNDLLLADNYSLLHGRNAFLENCPRHLRRIQLRNFI